MEFKGLVTPNWDMIGNGMAVPYGQAPPTSAAPTDSVMSMQGPQDSAAAPIGYKPEAGRADRLPSNIVGGFDARTGIPHR